MDPSSRQSQEMPNPSMLVTAKGNEQQERRPRPQPEQALKCPRCDSTNTKFCYYNNYSLSQPRYFCKSCRRYWTKGGTLRNVPVGGSCRKNRRSSSSKRTQDHTTLPPLSYGTDDLSLAYARLQKQANVNLGFDTNELSMLENPSGLAFIGNPNPFQGVYNYGSLGEVDNGSGTVTRVSNDMMTMLSCNKIDDGNKEITSNAAITTTSDVTMKQTEDRSVLLDLPWQFGGDPGNYNMAELDSGTESWGGLGSSWHGLLNSSLM